MLGGTSEFAGSALTKASPRATIMSRLEGSPSRRRKPSLMRGTLRLSSKIMSVESMVKPESTMWSEGYLLEQVS